ncbi:MAG: hypothetical protein HY280_08490 [Nitrospinae bacterium]|nr:hypothetical protein [Nitrospinota bacterium]
METQTLVIAAVFFLVAIILVAVLLYHFWGDEKPARKKSPIETKGVEKPKPAPAVPSAIKTSAKPIFELPDFIPKNLETIKMLAEERPEIVVQVARKWLREGRGK